MKPTELDNSVHALVDFARPMAQERSAPDQKIADYKEKVIDLLMRVTRVSDETVAITEAMRRAER
jgi:deoxyxylulose-5-phosphate synthase